MPHIETSSIIFLIALLGIVGMLVLKARELKSGHKNFLSRAGESTDQHVHAAYDATRHFLSYFNRHTAIALAQWVAAHVLSYLRRAYIWGYHLAHRHPHSKKVIDMVRGKGEVDPNGNGTSSAFLNHISKNAPISAPDAAPVLPVQPESHEAGVAEEPKK